MTPDTATQQNTTRQQAISRRDAAADGTFVFAVLTTGIYCNPSCAARSARPENLRFFTNPAQAEEAGYRPCRRCRPNEPPKPQRLATLAATICRAIEANSFDETTAANSEKITVKTLRKLFQTATGITIADYRKTTRQHAAQTALTQGTAVTTAIYKSGFGSSGRFYEAADAMLGMTPTAWRAGGAGETITHICAPCALGRVLVAFTTRGICAILLGDTDPPLQADLRHRFSKAQFVPAETPVASHLVDVIKLIETPAAAHTLPLDISGTAFQRRVWQALRHIPAGKTLSYSALAAQLNMPKSARAVARACAANKLAVAVPCHRVIANTGEVTGYRWGSERKRALLKQERPEALPLDSAGA